MAKGNIVISKYVVPSISFQAFFFLCRHLELIRLLKIQYVIAIHLMRWLANFYDFSFKWTSTVAIGIHPTKTRLSQLVNFKNMWGMMRGVGGVRKSIHKNWLAKGLGLVLRCWGFKVVQEEIRPEEARTLQIGPVPFPPGQCTSPQPHPCHRLFDQNGHQDCSLRSL